MNDAELKKIIAATIEHICNSGYDLSDEGDHEAIMNETAESIQYDIKNHTGNWAD